MTGLDPAALDGIVTAARAALPDLRAVWLFGSAAAGALRIDSDVDIAVLGCGAIPADRLAALRDGLEAALRRPVDLVDLDRATVVLRMQVIEHGQRVWARDVGDAELFATHAFSDYVRLEERRAGIMADIRRRGTVL